MGDKYVITAAHCVEGEYESDILVRVGDTSLDEEFEANSFTLELTSIKIHPDYDSSTFQNDIAVLELVEPVSLTENPNIKPACLPDAGAPFSGEAIVTGWGSVADGSYSTSYLQEVEVMVFSDTDCCSIITMDGMICAGHENGARDFGQGDNGGPLVAADPARNNSMSLIGVVSYSYYVGTVPSGYSFYTEVSKYMDWLTDQMPDLNTCPPPAEGAATTKTARIATTTTTATVTTTTTTTTMTTATTTVSCGNCVFPFIHQNRLSDRCTTIDRVTSLGWAKPWCATSVDADGVMIDSEDCTDPSCPGLEGNSAEMSVHPQNAVGNCCKFFP